MGQRNKWSEFWKDPYQLRPGRKHVDAHYKFLGEKFVGYFKNLQGKKVFSFGCGEAGEISWALKAGAKIFLYDQSPVFDKLVREKFAGNSQVYILTEEEWFRPIDEKFDVIYLSSVVQYFSEQELGNLLKKLIGMMAPGGRIAIIDVISKNTTPLADTLDFLRVSLLLGFWWSGLKTVFNLFRSSYMKTRDMTGFTKYDRADLEALVSPLGLKVVDQPRNLCLSARRQTFILSR